jgi:hypothetical protein
MASSYGYDASLEKWRVAVHVHVVYTVLLPWRRTYQKKDIKTINETGNAKEKKI